MTIVTVNQDVAAPLSERSFGFSSPNGTSGVRFSLRKRPNKDDKATINMSSYNSDFLSGLFADVAKVNVLSELGVQQKRGSELITPCDVSSEAEQTIVSATSSNKRSRVSLTRSNTKIMQSCKNLLDLDVSSPKTVTDVFPESPTNFYAPPTSTIPVERNDSLTLQLHCVSSEESSDRSTNTIRDIANIAFPNLPATISDSSCTSGLTRAKLDRQVSSPEADGKESFGWFVDLEGETPQQTNESSLSSSPYVSKSDDLAFSAPTAPKQVDYDAEIEWAKAADTVDDVLGDFF